MLSKQNISIEAELKTKHRNMVYLDAHINIYHDIC